MIARSRSPHRLRSLFACAVLGLTLPVHAGPPAFEILDLGVAIGSPHSVALSIASSGSVGGHFIGADGLQRGVIWAELSESAPVTILAPPDGVPWEAEISVVGLNASGQAAVSAFLPAFQHQSSHRWEAGAYTPLGTLGGSLSLPRAINAHGDIVGVSTLDPSPAGTLSGARVAYVHAGGRMLRVAGLAPGVSGQALAINDAGWIVGSAKPGEHHRGQAFLHDAAHGTRDLGALTGQIGRSEARDVNGAGLVVGVSGTGELLAAPGGGQAQVVVPVAWDHGRMVRLPTAPGHRVTEANAVNEPGWVVGSARFATTPGVQDRAQLWIDGDRLDLTSLLPPLSEWEVLTAAHDVADNGVIVGAGMRNGEVHAFALLPCPR